MYDRCIVFYSSIPKHCYQKIALACLIVAIKRHEDSQPNYEEMRSYTANAYTIKNIKECEQVVLNNIHPALHDITAAHFFKVFVECAKNDSSFLIHELSTLYLDQSLLSTLYYRYLPSEIAMAALVSARRKLQMQPLPATLMHLIQLYNGDVDKINECCDHFGRLA